MKNISSDKMRILFLGGAYFQLPVLKYAASKNYYIILCDYLSDNPGKEYANEYFEISTLSMDKILDLAKRRNINSVVSFASETSAFSGAFIAEKLRLPGNPVAAVNTLLMKDVFRKFLKDNGFNVPKVRSYKNFDEFIIDPDRLAFPFMLKPVDSCGAQGVELVNSLDQVAKAFKLALGFSRSKRILTEEYIPKKGPQLHGEAFVVNGRIVFIFLGDHHFHDYRPLTPFATTVPSSHSKENQEQIYNLVQLVVEKLGYVQGALNIEIRINHRDELHIIEIAPRSGGYLVPQLSFYYTGFDEIKSTVEISLGNKLVNSCYTGSGFFASYSIGSNKHGILKSIEILEPINSMIIERHFIKLNGDKIETFKDLHNILGVFIIRFDSEVQMNYMIKNMEDYIKIKIV